jgi:hypothetical protein
VANLHHVGNVLNNHESASQVFVCCGKGPQVQRRLRKMLRSMKVANADVATLAQEAAHTTSSMIVIYVEAAL